MQLAVMNSRGVARIFEWGDETPKASRGVGLGGGVPLPNGVGTGEGAMLIDRSLPFDAMPFFRSAIFFISEVALL